MKELLKKLIAAKSAPDCGEKEAAAVLSEFFASSGIESKTDVWEGSRANITAKIGSGKEAVLFLSHLDVVPAGREKWQSEPFEPAERDGKIFGRGACDMKGGIAAVAYAMAAVQKSGVKLSAEVIFAATAGEETDSCGIKRFLESEKISERKIIGAIVPEPTNMQIITAHRGLLWLEITTKGKPAHSSMPQQGVNAIETMRLFLNEFDKLNLDIEPDALLGGCTRSLNKISGGSASNIVPDKCCAVFDIRTIPQQNQQEIISAAEGICAGLKQNSPPFEAHLKIIRAVEPMKIDSNCRFITALKRVCGQSEIAAAPFTTDAPYIANLNIPLAVLGPGLPQLCHKSDEFIEIADLEKAAAVYADIIRHFCG